ncbi:MAG: hypothetical protein IPO41_00905 [Acidobacteria bacterium]|nr:hypothetical protein [Acidobacteriota bacterium]
MNTLTYRLEKEINPKRPQDRHAELINEKDQLTAIEHRSNQQCGTSEFEVTNALASEA